MSTEIPLTIDSVLVRLPSHESQRFLFKRLDLETLQVARTVSKLWQSLVDPLLEFHVCLNDQTSKYVSAFGTSRPVTTLTTTDYQRKYPFKGHQLSVNMLRITVDVELMELDSDSPYRVRAEEGRNIGLTDHNFIRLLGEFYFVERFHIASLAVRDFAHPKMLSKVFLPCVKEMIITFFDSGLHQLLPFLKNFFPNLRSVNIANVAETSMDRPLLYTWIFGFIAKHHALEDVSVIFPEGMMENSPVQLQPNINRHLRRDHRMPRRLYENVKRSLKNMKLTRLAWDVSMLEGTGRYDLGTAILSEQTQLHELLLDNLHIKDRPLWNRVGKLVEKCSATLKSLTLGGCMCGSPAIVGRPNVFSCSWLKKCEQLENLEMVVCGIFVGSIEDLPREKLRSLNLGHMLHQEQIEYIALNMVNLESWVLPQRGCKVNILVPKINVYLFEVILHLPKLSRLNLLAQCAEEDKILEFVSGEQGIVQCGHLCMDYEKNGNLGFHVCRGIFQRDHSKLPEYMIKYRSEILGNVDMNDAEVVEFFLRHLILANLGDNVYFMQR